jgi:hypothetical protein
MRISSLYGLECYALTHNAGRLFRATSRDHDRDSAQSPAIAPRPPMIFSLGMPGPSILMISSNFPCQSHPESTWLNANHVHRLSQFKGHRGHFGGNQAGRIARTPRPSLFLDISNGKRHPAAMPLRQRNNLPLVTFSDLNPLLR